MAQALRLCPTAVVLPVRMAAYAAESKELHQLLTTFAPEVQQASIDEAFVPIAGLRRVWGEPIEMARRIKAATFSQRQLRVSVGGAASRYFAKLASAQSKPDGLLLIEPGEERTFLATLQVKDLWGVGRSTEKRLRERGITSVAELLDVSRSTGEAMLGQGASSFLAAIASGEDPGIFTGRRRSRSVSSETTFVRDSTDLRTLEHALLGLAHRIVNRMLATATESRTIVLKIRDASFTTKTVRRSLDHPFSSATEVFQTARALLRERWDGRTPLRLLGLGFAAVRAREPAQGDLFEDRFSRSHKVEVVVADINATGAGLTKASLLRKPSG
jgi:DNA polymerase-4